MSELSFAVYTVCCLAAFAGQLVFALREWRVLDRRDAMYVDQVYVRVERYFGLAFREKLQEWLRRPARDVAPGVSVIEKEREEIWVHEALIVPAGGRFDAIVVADTLETGYGCVLLREVYSRYDCRLGDANVVQALAGDGAVRLGRGTRVIRWVDAVEDLVIEPHCRVLGRATSATRLTLHVGAKVTSACAPVVTTVGTISEPPADVLSADDVSRVVLADDESAWHTIGASGIRRQLSSDCVGYDGDLVLPAVTIRSKLVVRGDLLIGPHSIVEGDIKATGSIHVGAQSNCRGSLVAGRDVHLASRVTFRGVIFAEGSIAMAAGVTGVRSDPGVAVYAAETVSLQPGVTIHGKVSSGNHVVVVDA